MLIGTRKSCAPSRTEAEHHQPRFGQVGFRNSLLMSQSLPLGAMEVYTTPWAPLRQYSFQVFSVQLHFQTHLAFLCNSDP